MLSYLPVVGSYFVNKKTPIAVIESFLMDTEKVWKGLIAGIDAAGDSSRGKAKVIFPHAFNNSTKDIMIFNSWYEFLDANGILIDGNIDRNGTIVKFHVEDCIRFLFEFISTLHNLYSSLLTQKTNIVIQRVPGLSKVLTAYDIIIERDDTKITIQPHYNSPIHNYSSVMADIENSILSLYSYDTDVGDEYKFSGFLPITEDMEREMWDIKRTGNVRHFRSALVQEEMKENLTKMAEQARIEMEASAAERDSNMGTGFKTMCTERNLESVCPYKPTVTGDWCDVPSEQYYDIADPSFTRCFDIIELLQYFETKLGTTKYGNPYPQAPHDWNNRKVFTFDQLHEIIVKAKNLSVAKDYPLFTLFMNGISNGELVIPDGSDWSRENMQNVIDYLRLRPVQSGGRYRYRYRR